MVSEVQVDDDRVAEELFKEQSGSDSGNAGNGNSGNSGNGGNGNKVKVTTSSSTSLVDHDERWGDIYEDMPAKRKLALYDYDPVELSPNVDAEVELSFRAGDIILVCKFLCVFCFTFCNRVNFLAFGLLSGTFWQFYTY